MTMPQDDILDEKEKSEEARFKLRQELRFKAQSRRNKLLGLWAAERMGLTDSETEDYAKAVVMADFEEPGEDDVLRKILSDFEARGVKATEAQVTAKMEALMEEAFRQVEAEFPSALGPDHEPVGG